MPTTDCGYENSQFGRKLLIHYGPELGVTVGFDPDYKRNSTSAPKFKFTSTSSALVDTGARESCIDVGLAEALALPVYDRRTISGASGVLDVDYHLAQIHVPSLRFTIMGGFAAVPLAKSGFRQHVILGRSFLAELRLQYDGPTASVKLTLD